ncbi:MAG: hypothetical protein JXQ93_01090 [Flavobacteriaceae bacterium]
MKTLRRSIMVALIFGTLISYASTNNVSTIKDVKAFIVKLHDVRKGNRIYVKNADGDIIISKTIQQKGNYSKVINLSALKDGHYKVEIDKDFEILITSIEISKGKVLLEKSYGKKIYKPVFRTKENKVYISKIAFDSPDLKVKIYYEDELILSDSVNGKEILKRIYSLSEDLRGNYKVIMKTNDRTYIEKFSL